MDRATLAVAVITVAAAKGAAVLGSWARLHWRIRYAYVRGGHRLHLTVTRAPGGRDDETA